jgi:hypothetical protein
LISCHEKGISFSNEERKIFVELKADLEETHKRRK